MSIKLANTILVVVVFLVILLYQVLSQRSRTKHDYKNSLFWDINSLLMAANQQWVILGVTWYTTAMKGLLIGINVVGFICVAISMVTTLEYQLRNVPADKE